MKRFATAFAALLLFSAVAQAGSLSDINRDWAKSPQAYFMTQNERNAWNAITTDEAASTFIQEYLARRGGDTFVKEVAKRAAIADQHLSVGKIKGSSTIGGKLLILFGAPANIAVADRQGKKGYNPPPSSAAVSNLGTSASASSGGGGRDDSPTEQVIGGGEAGRMFRDYTYTFAGKSVPGLNRDQYSIVVSVDMGTGKDELKNARDQKELDLVMESVAQASIQQK